MGLVLLCVPLCTLWLKGLVGAPPRCAICGLLLIFLRVSPRLRTTYRKISLFFAQVFLMPVSLCVPLRPLRPLRLAFGFGSSPCSSVISVVKGFWLWLRYAVPRGGLRFLVARLGCLKSSDFLFRLRNGPRRLAKHQLRRQLALDCCRFPVFGPGADAVHGDIHGGRTHGLHRLADGGERWNK